MPETPGNRGPLSVYGPYWGDIGCETMNFYWPGSKARVIMVPICKGKKTGWFIYLKYLKIITKGI